MDNYVRLLLTISICCCIVGFLMWLFLKWYKSASIRILLLCTVLLLVRFLYPHEFSFTRTVYITRGYPALNNFFRAYLPLTDDKLSVAHLLIGIWILGILIAGIQLLRRYRLLQKAIRQLPAAQDPVVLAQLDRILAERHFAGSKFCIKESANLCSPFVTGFFHPVIVVPKLALSEQDWYYILAHETAHYLHGDTLYKILIELLRIVFWWNPLFYLFRRKIAVYIEESADLLATEHLNAASKMEYLECLLRVAEKSLHNPMLSSSVLAFDGYAASELKQRFTVITKSIHEPQKLHKKHGQYSFIAAMLLVTFISYGIIVEPSCPDPPADDPNTFTLSDTGYYAIKCSDSLYELYMNGELVAKFTDPANLPGIPIYEKEDLP